MNTLILVYSVTILFYEIRVVNCQEECLVINFEDDLVEPLTGCEGSDAWQYGEYASIVMQDRPENLVGGTRFVTPTSDGSCGSTAENIHIRTGGILEVNFYIETLEEITPDDANACIDIYGRNENDWISTDCIFSTEFEDGWNNLIIHTNTDVEAYVLLRGLAFESFIFWIDSLRYIDATVGDATVGVCKIYDGEEGGDSGNSGDESNGEDNGDEGNNDNDNDCFIMNFEGELVEPLTECESSDTWHYGEYESIVMQERPENLIGGTRFITPTTDGSCGSTAENIHVHIGGTLEVNFYIETLEENTSDDANACIYIYGRNEDDLISTDCIFSTGFEDGWNNLNIQTNIDVEAYVLLRGKEIDGLLFLIDSLRYRESGATTGECPIYEDEEDENGGGESENSEEYEDSEEDNEEHETTEDSDETLIPDPPVEENTEEHETTENSDENSFPDPPGGVPENGGLNAGAIAGIAIGAVVIVIAIGILAYVIGLKQGNKKSSPPQYNETQSYVMDLPRPVSMPRARAIIPQQESLDVYNNNNNDPQVYKLEIHNHFSR